MSRDEAFPTIPREEALGLQRRVFLLMDHARRGDYWRLVVEFDDPHLKAHLRTLIGEEPARVLAARIQIAYGGYREAWGGLGPISKGELLSFLNKLNQRLGEMAGYTG